MAVAQLRGIKFVEKPPQKREGIPAGWYPVVQDAEQAHGVLIEISEWLAYETIESYLKGLGRLRGKIFARAKY